MITKTFSLKELYTEDESIWIFENVKLIREGKIDEVDWVNIAEELELMGKSQFREVYSRMKELMLHLLKWKYQKEFRSNSWKYSIRNQRGDLQEIFNDSKNLKNYALENFERVYSDARKLTSDETGLPRNIFPIHPPFTLEEIMKEEFFPE